MYANQMVNTSLTLMDIAPKWAGRFAQLPISRWSWKSLQWALEMSAAEICVVGEAHGNSASYIQNCNKCETFGSIYQSAFISHSSERLNKTTNNFLTHWNEKHSHITIQRLQE